MNYISTNHRGGLGNVMFKIAATIGVALDNHVDYLFGERENKVSCSSELHGRRNQKN